MESEPSREAPVALGSLSVSGLRVATDAAMCRVATPLLAHALLVQLTHLRVDCTHVFNHPLHHCSNVARFDRVQPITCLHALSKHLQTTHNNNLQLLKKNIRRHFWIYLGKNDTLHAHVMIKQLLTHVTGFFH